MADLPPFRMAILDLSGQMWQTRSDPPHWKMAILDSYL